MKMAAIGSIVVLMIAVAGDAVFAQQAPTPGSESHKYRAIGTLAGAGGGFTLGVFAGIGAFDDAINADRKVWTTALIAAAGGAVGGYFLGRAVDKSRKKSGPAPGVTPWVPDELDRSLTRARLEGIRMSAYPRQSASGFLRPELDGAAHSSFQGAR